RLDAQVVAGEENRGSFSLRVPPAAVEHREREHPSQPVDAVGTPFHIGLQHHFRVSARAEAVTACLQIGTQLLEIVHLAFDRDAEAGLHAMYSRAIWATGSSHVSARRASAVPARRRSRRS